MRSPAPPELAAGSSIADWDLVPLTFYVALPSMLRETLTLDRDVTVGKVKEIIEFLTLIKVQEQHLFHSAIEGFKKLQDDTKTLRDVGAVPNNLLLVEPQPYLEFNYLVKHAKAVITDSGGITEETTVMGVPCMTLRNSTERPETVTMGTNELLGIDPKALKPALDRLFAGQWKRGSIPPLWDGHTSERIVKALESVLGA
jgi:UDP-N-acetylglucosamine 2-epimerase